ncbi:spore germination protein [Halobacillus shinanisalinarum]|uniref:Spore germination protein n=1 Tax=Halobacillus shinanisalinarum TaxID=2932258 RepID=A0ABY4GUL9_9BACI|nr:spore germination protein [Halobacillus shinanisalinarum]UOQ91651.1 spore germination protein [Halobacillus shinanisalinarum]
MFNWTKKKKGKDKESYQPQGMLKQEGQNPEASFQDLYEMMKQSKDFVIYQHSGRTSCVLSYYKTLSGSKFMNELVLPILKKHALFSLEDIKERLPVENVYITRQLTKVKEKITRGYIVIQMQEGEEEALLIPATKNKSRNISIPEVEFSVVGPKEAFVESLDTNINLIRKRLPIPELTMREVSVGKLTKTRVAVVYIDEVANKENVNTVMQRLNDIQYDQIIDSSFITQMIADNSSSPFPQFLDTERPDRVVGTLVEGKIAVVVDGSPHALVCPTTIVEFFSSSDDYFLPWHLATVFRLIRLCAILFSVLSTPLYVAVLTYHHEMIPQELLATIISSRADIPFPPILEVIILELTIELLREAGARLPTKIGQTIGIVGGIVIGTAAVEAGMTSNVLLIIVALAALASFTTPVYQIGNTVRLVRFPFIIGAQMWGLIGVTMCMAFFIGHLMNLQSIGRPFFAPLYPLRFNDLKDAFIRLPFNKQKKRPMQTRPVHSTRFDPNRIKGKRDIDE